MLLINEKTRGQEKIQIQQTSKDGNHKIYLYIHCKLPHLFHLVLLKNKVFGRQSSACSFSQLLLILLYMQLHVIEEKDKFGSLPRVNHEFIGLGHELESFRKQRKQAQQQHQAIENRVLLLEKQQSKARKQLIKKKHQLEQIINIRERQQHESQQKARNLQQKMEQLERLKRQNQISRMIHKNNYESTINQLRDKNHSDYSRIRQERIDGEYSKRVQKNDDLQEKKNNWLSLNISKEKGRIRIDHFHKKKNKEHVKQYQSRIYLENSLKQSQINSIRNLQIKQQAMRTKLENVSMKNSKMEQLLKSISRTLSPMNTSQIQAQLYGTSRTKKSSYQTLFLTERQKKTSVPRLDQTERSDPQKLSRSRSINNKQVLGDYVEENIEVGDDQADRSSFKIIHRRKKNKHINRYKEYQAY